MSNCIYDCSYCILQDFLWNNPLLKAFVNIEDVLTELGAVFDRYPKNIYRVGTGEIADSLALENILPYTDYLIPFFNLRENAVLELKTKSACVDNLLQHDPKNVIVSWSINPRKIVDAEEKFASSLKDRLDAARRCREKGFRIGIHFDPVILFQGWEEAYQETVNLLFDTLGDEPLEVISLGGFRYRSLLKRVASERHPDSLLFHGEYVKGEDGKYRYLRTLRNNAFKTLRGFIRERSPGSGVYLCMEPKEIWKDVTGALPRADEKLDVFFDAKA